MLAKANVPENDAIAVLFHVAILVRVALHVAQYSEESVAAINQGIGTTL